jgi:hypothetical protein
VTTREEWLTKAKDLIIEQIFKPHELRFPPLVKVGCAPLPCKMTDDGVAVGTYGICIYPEQAEDGCVHIFINTVLGNGHIMEILGTLVHELVHAHVMGEGHECKHGFPFSKIIRTVGLEGKPKSTTVGEDTELHATLSGIAMQLGDYPHAPIRPKMTKKRQSEMLTLVSGTDPEFTVKVKFSQVYEKGMPKDFNGEPMVAKDPAKFAELEEAYLSQPDEEQEAADVEEKAAE